MKRFPTDSLSAPVADLAVAVRGGDRAALARAITLIESRRVDHAAQAADLLQELLPTTGNAVRIGLTGAPGVGKSTLIDALGTLLTQAGHRVAVLAVDPSSTLTGGSILGDKTRMARLSANDRAYIRPSPSAGTLGGVAARTREAMLLCEAAGYDVVLVETVGIGQSETAVADMTDCFVALMLPGAGDELQGIKKGLIERADILCVNKAEGDNRARAQAAAADYRAALHILAPSATGWTAPVLTASAQTGEGIETLWETIGRFRAAMNAGGAWQARRQRQQVGWMRAMLQDALFGKLRADPAVRRALKEAEAEVAAGRLAPRLAVARLAPLLGL